MWSHEGDESLVTLSIDGEIIIATAGHPFYTTDGEWIAAGDLQIGTEVYSADGTHGTLDALVITDGTAWVYNLTVDEAHTYFVGDGQWLVHNVDCPRPLETTGWDNRHRGQPSKSAEYFSNGLPVTSGLYEYQSALSKTRIYVGMAQGQSIGGRLSGKMNNFGKDWNNVVFSYIDFPNIRIANIAERIRIEQIWSLNGQVLDVAQVKPPINGVYKLNQVATRQQVIDYMNTNQWKDIIGWPEWLHLPSNLIELPPGIK